MTDKFKVVPRKSSEKFRLKSTRTTHQQMWDTKPKKGVANYNCILALTKIGSFPNNPEASKVFEQCLLPLFVELRKSNNTNPL